MSNIKVAIAGVGSCASSLIQLVQLAKNEDHRDLSGVMFEKIGPYFADNIDFVCAFEVDNNKVGLDLSEAIFTSPTVAIQHIEVPNLNVVVDAGALHDGLEGNLSDLITPHPDSIDKNIESIVSKLKEKEVDVLVCYLPTGSYNAVRNYAKAALQANVAFINATPEPVSADEGFQKEFLDKKVPLLGDDMRSHLGATTLHTALIELLLSRGLTIDNTYQLNFGGNTDFLNLTQPTRNASKQKTKKSALYAAGIDAENVAAGPNGYVKYLGDEKVCYLRMEATSVLGSNITIETRLQVEDSPNSAGVIISGIRVAKLAKDRGLGGVIDEACPLLFKNSRHGATESEGLKLFKDFLIEPFSANKV